MSFNLPLPFLKEKGERGIYQQLYKVHIHDPQIIYILFLFQLKNNLFFIKNQSKMKILNYYRNHSRISEKFHYN